MLNAVDAMPQGGTLTLRAYRAAGRALLEVADTGTGMTEQVRQRCLEPFYSTKGESGTGLGLAMVHGIVRRHNGTIEIESAPGYGTTIRLCFPVLPSGAIRSTTTELRQPGAPSRHSRVLVVDDDPQVCE